MVVELADVLLGEAARVVEDALDRRARLRDRVDLPAHLEPALAPVVDRVAKRRTLCIWPRALDAHVGAVEAQLARGERLEVRVEGRRLGRSHEGDGQG